MYFRYGIFLAQLDEAGIAFEQVAINVGGVQVGVEETWRVSGFKIGASTAALVTACTTMERAFGVNGMDALLILNDGTTVARRMPGVHPLGGTEVVRMAYPVDGTGENGAEFVGHRTWNVEIRGRYAVNTPPAGTLISWNEMIAFVGGGPHDEHVESMLGLPQKQRLKQFTTFRAFQSGSAVGLLGWPTPPIPFWPAAEKIPLRQVKWHSPKRSGGQGAPVFTEFMVEWSYEFAATLPLIGRPTYWR